MSYKEYDDVLIEVEGSQYLVGFTHEYAEVSDHNYGADADGNRGRHETFIEDEDVSDIVIWDDEAGEWIDVESDREELFKEVILSWLDKSYC